MPDRPLDQLPTRRTPRSSTPASAAPATSAPASRGSDVALSRQVDEVLGLIRPSIQQDGGDVELVEVTGEGVVRIRLHGACVGCPSSTMTLRMGLEQNLRDNVPGVTAVEAVD